MNALPRPLPRTLDVLSKSHEARLQAGVQLYVSLGGAVVADIALGEARPGGAMQPDTVTVWFSAGKPLTAVALARLVERGLAEVDDRVTRFVPEFGQGGKESLTLSHLLTHTGGFRDADKISGELPWDETIAQICATPLEAGWIPGTQAAYQLFSSWFILAEIIRRLDGRAFDRFLREEVCLPAGMPDSWIGIPPEQFRAYGERVGLMYLSGRSGLRPHPPFNGEAACAACRPGSNARGPVRELGRFYEALLNLPGRPSLLQPETVRQFTARHRVGLYDQTFRHVLDFGLGFILHSNRYGAETVPYSYGPHATEAAFGHSGSQSSCAFADPEHQLVVAWLCNGLPGEAPHQRRANDINRAIYEDLGLAGSPR